MNKSPFTVSSGVEVLASEVTARQSVVLITALLAVALCYGLDRTEAAIKTSYTKADAALIIQAMNTAMAHFAKSEK